MPTPANDAMLFSPEKEGAQTWDTSPAMSLVTGTSLSLFPGKVFSSEVKLRLKMPDAQASKGWWDNTWEEWVLFSMATSSTSRVA